MASCASWAFLTLVAILRGWSGQVFLAVLRGHQVAGRLDGHAGQVGRVGTHISNVAVFVQALRHLHRAAGREAQLAIGFLLQRAGGERRIGLRGVGLVVQAGDAELGLAQPRGQISAPGSSRCSRPVVLELAGGRIEILARRNRAGLRPKLSSACKPSRRWPVAKRADQVPAGGRDEAPSAAVRARRSAARPRFARGRPRACGRTFRHNSGETS